MILADFDTVVWGTGSVTDTYTKIRDNDRKENGEFSGTIGSTQNLGAVISAPHLMSDAEKHAVSRQMVLTEGEVEAIAVWKPNAFKKHVVNVGVVIPGSDIPGTNRLEIIEKALLEKAGLKPGERAINIKILSETPKYVSTMVPAEHNKTSYHIIGNGIDANAILKYSNKGFDTRTEAKAELKNILSRSRATKFNLPVTESFEIIGITRIVKAKAELSQLAVRAKLDVVTVNPDRPRDGWLFYGIGVL